MGIVALPSALPLMQPENCRRGDDAGDAAGEGINRLGNEDEGINAPCTPPLRFKVGIRVKDADGESMGPCSIEGTIAVTFGGLSAFATAAAPPAGYLTDAEALAAPLPIRDRPGVGEREGCLSRAGDGWGLEPAAPAELGITADCLALAMCLSSAFSALFPPEIGDFERAKCALDLGAGGAAFGLFAFNNCSAFFLAVEAL